MRRGEFYDQYAKNAVSIKARHRELSRVCKKSVLLLWADQTRRDPFTITLSQSRKALDNLSQSKAQMKTHLSQSEVNICPNPRHERISKGNPIKENASLGSFAPLATHGAQLPFSSEAFNKCWNQWISHCKERGTKITATQTELLFDKLKTWGEVKTIEAINHSITSGWHSIQEAHQKPETSKNEEPPKNKYVPLVL